MASIYLVRTAHAVGISLYFGHGYGFGYDLGAAAANLRAAVEEMRLKMEKLKAAAAVFRTREALPRPDRGGRDQSLEAHGLKPFRWPRRSFTRARRRLLPGRNA